MAEAGRRRLSVAEAVRAAGIIFELNTAESSVLAIAAAAGVPCGTDAEKAALMLEWRAFVHAAVLYGLMAHAPNVVVVEYLRVTQEMLGRLGYAPEEAEAFVDGPFREYSDPMVRVSTKECPEVFFRRLLGRELSDVPERAAAMFSGVMAMVISAALDKLEQYEYALD
ncbi:MAG: hypothetical protein MJ061_02095 [Mailhella sp.]|nr:hypothetical protein [Mailhella sp.]